MSLENSNQPPPPPEFLLNPNPFEFTTKPTATTTTTTTTTATATTATSPPTINQNHSIKPSQTSPSSSSTPPQEQDQQQQQQQHEPQRATHNSFILHNSNPTQFTSTPNYYVNAFGVIDRPTNSTIPRLAISNRVPGGGDCARLCPRHQRMANEGTNRALQAEIERLPQPDQEAINTAWSIFSASNVHSRRLILTGLLTICCPSQLTFLSDSLKTVCRTDPFSRLPKELSLRILSYFDAFSLGRAAQVSKLWKKLADDDLLWREMCQQHIERTCQKCGWGLPSMVQKRRRSPSIPNPSSNPSSNSSLLKSSKLQPILHSETHSKRSKLSTNLSSSERSPSSNPRSPSPSYGPSSPSTSAEDSTKPWKSVYTERLALERNWRKGIYVEKILTGHTDSITTLQIEESFESPSFPILMTGSWDRSIKIWNLERLECIQTLIGHTRGVKCLQFDSNKLLSGSMDNSLKLWNWRTGECIRTIHGHTDGVTCLNFDDELLASGSADSTIRIWNFNTGAGYVLRGHQEWINTVRLDTKTFIMMKKKKKGKPKLTGGMTNQGEEEEENKMIRLKLLYSGSDDGQIRIWNLNDRQTIKILVGHVAQVQSISLLTSNHPLPLPTTTTTTSMTSTSNNNNNIIHPEHHQQQQPNEYQLEDCLISGSLDNCIKLWKLKFNVLNHHHHLHQNYPDHNDDNDAENEEEEDQVRLDVSIEGFCDRTLFGHIQGVWSVDADKLRIVSASHDRSLKIWDRLTGKCVHTFVGHRGAVSIVKLTHDKIISGGDDGEIRIWWFGQNS